MIYSLRGSLLEKGDNFCVIECAGVGYKCQASLNTLSSLPNEGEEVFLYTYMALREDSCDLFGFKGKEELELFRLLTGVSGVGPKMAMAILSTFPVSTVILAIAQEDIKTLSQSPGVGKKLASRIALELRDKVTPKDGSTLKIDVREMGKEPRNLSNEAEAREALMALGYPASVASAAIGKCKSDLSVEEMIKQALKSMAK